MEMTDCILLVSKGLLNCASPNMCLHWSPRYSLFGCLLFNFAFKKKKKKKKIYHCKEFLNCPLWPRVGKCGCRRRPAFFKGLQRRGEKKLRPGNGWPFPAERAQHGEGREQPASETEGRLRPPWETPSAKRQHLSSSYGLNRLSAKDRGPKREKKKTVRCLLPACIFFKN